VHVLTCCFGCAVDFSDDDPVSMICRHLDDLEANPVYRNAVLFLYIEANFGGWPAAKTTWDKVRGRGSNFGTMCILPICKDPDGLGRVGVWTYEETKEVMAMESAYVLSNGLVHFAEHFVTRYNHVTQQEALSSGLTDAHQVTNLNEERLAQGQRAMISKIADQMRVYRKDTERVGGDDKNKNAKMKVHWSGKHAGPDDLCVGWQLCEHHGSFQRESREYRQIEQGMGWRHHALMNSGGMRD
jgi:hypothetical protein